MFPNARIPDLFEQIGELNGRKLKLFDGVAEEHDDDLHFEHLLGIFALVLHIINGVKVNLCLTFCYVILLLFFIACTIIFLMALIR